MEQSQLGFLFFEPRFYQTTIEVALNRIGGWAFEMSVYGFADWIGSFPMELQKTDGIFLRNSFSFNGMTLVSKLQCITASQ